MLYSDHYIVDLSVRRPFTNDERPIGSSLRANGLFLSGKSGTDFRILLKNLARLSNQLYILKGEESASWVKNSKPYQEGIRTERWETEKRYSKKVDISLGIEIDI